MTKDKANIVKQSNNSPISLNDLIAVYVEENMELVRLELILDNLFMAKEKDEDWSEKNRIAQDMYNEVKERLVFLNVLWKQRDTLAG